MRKTIATKPGEPTKHVEMTAEEVKVRITEATVWKAEQAATKYIRKREAEYPSIQEQLDMIYHDQRNGTNVWYETIDSIKLSYPKP